MLNWLSTGATYKIAAVVTLADPHVTEALGSSDVDFFIADMEHAPISERELEGILIAATSVQKPVLVRVVENSPSLIKRVLDTGPAGVIVPNVSTPSAAQAAVAAAMYPPLGIRGYGPRRANTHGHESAAFATKSNEELLVLVQIEHAAAVHLAPEIVRVPGVGGVMIGPYDLSASMGLLGQVDHPSVLANVEAVIAACQDAAVPVGCGGYFGAMAERMIGLGINFITAGGDIWLMRQQLDETIAALREIRQPSLHGGIDG